MTTGTISITLNGKPRDIPAGANLPALLDLLGVDRRMIAVAHNGDVIARDQYDQIVLGEGDRIEVVRMVGGG